jgi:hypothetical protein
MVQAGDIAQISWSSGQWVFLDIGFSHDRASCGLLVGDGEPQCFTFGDAGHRLVEVVRSAIGPVNLVIEAPLSACFGPEGNPKGRSIESEEGQHRYWYYGAAASVMLASMYMVRAVHAVTPELPVRLFEGFVSYKSRVNVSDHELDVKRLRDVVKSPQRAPGQLVSPEQLKSSEGDRLVCAFEVAGISCGIPPVIKP